MVTGRGETDWAGIAIRGAVDEHRRMTREGKSSRGSGDEAPVRSELEWAKSALAGLGGWAGLKSGSWFYDFARSTFKNYSERCTPEYFRDKYPGMDD